ncbi:MAG: hypothetical protein MUF71_18425 [Candidatus Kapabacteria bacterium]|jgi:hypothetical protein|nr:hypothetical protein [Candidatus Kapabacteria bacterium]
MKTIRFVRVASLCAVFFILAFQYPLWSQKNVVREDGNTIEFIGLKQWTIKQLVDSVRKYEPDGKLGFCAATLESKLGFRDASVIWFAKDSTIITVVEPQDSALVRRNTNFPELLFLPRQWYEFQQKYSYKILERRIAMECQEISDDSANIVFSLRNKNVNVLAKADSMTFWNIRTALKSNNRPIAQLSKIVQLSGDPYARGIAVLAMSSLADNDTCLQMVLHSLLDVSANTFMMPANESFMKMLKHRTRPIVLKPMISDLQRLVNGTNLFAYQDVLRLISSAKPTEQEFNAIFATEQSRNLLFAHIRAVSSYARQEAASLMKIVNPQFSESEQKKYLNIR